MAVDSYTYGTVALVHDRVGWVVPARAAFASGTTPSESEVEAILDSVCSEIHAILVENGYPADTKTAITTAAARAVKWLEMLNVVGACAQILQSFAVANDPESGNSPAAFWQRLYENGKKLIAGDFLATMGLTKTEASSDLMVSGSYLNTSGTEKAPLFKRDMWNYPGTDPITDEDD